MAIGSVWQAQDLAQEAAHGCAQRLEVAGEAVVARHGDDAPRAHRRGGIPNGSLAPCTTSVGTATASSSGSRVFSGRPGRADREGEAEHAGGAGLRRGAAGHARARRAPAGHDRQAAQRPAAQVLDDRGPGRVELGRRRGRATAGDAIRLLDERHADPERQRGPRRRDQVAGGDAAPGAVAEHERPGRRVDVVHVHARGTVRGVDRGARHQACGSRRALARVGQQRAEQHR